MPVATRGVRGFINSDQRLENLGWDRFEDAGNEAAVARAGLSFSLHRAGSEIVREGFPAPLGTLQLNPLDMLTATEIGFGDSAVLLTSANLAAIGFGTDVGAFSRLQYGLADIFIEAQLAAGGTSGAARNAALAQFVSLNTAAIVEGGYVAIDAVAADGNGAALLAQLEALGLERGASFGRLAGGLMPLDMLDELASVAGLGFARPVYAMTNVGLTTSQNVVSMNADYLQSLGLNGSGITIGVISDSFDRRTAPITNYTQDQANGDLPSGILILDDAATGTLIDEGRAMAQLIYDVAPGTTLQFHTAFVSMAGFAQGIIDLLNAGSDIIVDDVIYFAETMFQDHIVAQAVDTATAGGAMYFSSAGNNASLSYQSAFRPSGQLFTAGGVTYELHDFDPGAGQDIMQSITKAGTVTYTLNWDQPSFSVSGGAGAQSNMTMLLFTGPSTVQFTGTNNIGGDAVEIAQNATAYIGMGFGVRVGDPYPTTFKTVMSGNFVFNEWATNSGTAYGHANAATAISVGAVDWGDSMRFAGVHPSAALTAGQPLPYLESFSSRGDVPILFDIAGNRLAAPVYRSSVDFSAGDGGNNSFFGNDVTYDADAFGNFFGTSAAAPNAAAVAALLMQRFPTATRAQIELALKMSAVDIQYIETNVATGVGYDNISGWGLIQADRAMAALDAMLNANGILTAGEIAIIAYNTGQSDATGNPPTTEALRFVALTNLVAGQVIYFTDRTWNGTAFTTAAGDGTATYTVPMGGIAAGTTINLTGAALGTLNLDETAGDTIYAYTGTIDSPGRFLFAIEIGDGNTVFGGSLTNTGLTAGVNAVAVGLDSASYHGPTSEAGAHLYNGESLIENISDTVNWEGDNRGGQNALDQVDHIGPYLMHSDFSIWSAGIPGGDAVVSVQGDATVNSGLTGFNLNYLLTLDNEDLADTLVNPRDIAFDPVRGLFFVIDTTGGQAGRILQGNISDLLGNPGVAPALTTLYTSNQVGLESQIRDMHVDTANGIIYFTHGQRFEKIVMNTAGQTSTVLANLATGNPGGSTNNFADDFVINFATGDVYLTSHRVISGQDGDDVTKNYLYRINGLDPADGTGAFSFALGNLVRMNFNPDDDDVMDGVSQIPEGFPKEFGTLEGVALSADGNTLYFTTASILWDHDADGGFPGDGNPGTTDPQLRMGGVYSYALTGNAAGNFVLIYQQVSGSGPQGLLDDIEVDPVTGTLYFLDQTGQQMGISNPPGDEGIWRINPNGTGLTFFQPIHNVNSLAANSIYINRAPTSTASGLAAAVTEASNGPGSGITNAPLLFNNVTLSDVDTAGGDELRHAVVRISNNFLSGATHQDLLRIQGNTSGTIAGSGIVYNYNSATGVMTLTGPATVAEYKAALELVTFATSGDNVTDYGNNTVRTIAFSVSDGLNLSDEITNTVTVTGINDAPVNTVPGAAAAATEDLGLVLTGMSVFDVDADPANEDITVTLSVTNGTITVFTNVGGGIEAADVTGNGTASVTITATQNQINATFAAANGVTYAAAANYNGAATLTVVTNDLGNNGNDPGLTGNGTSEQDSDTRPITIAAVNDAPTVAGDGTESLANIFEDQPSAVGQTVSALVGGQFSDALDQQQTGGNPTGSVANLLAGIAVVSSGTSASGDWQYFNGASWVNIGAATPAAAVLLRADAAIRFNPALNFNGPAPALTVRLVDDSGGALTNGATVDLSAFGSTGGTTRYSTGTVALSQQVDPVNDAPTSTNLSGDIATYNEGSAAVLLDVGSNLTIADIDSLNFDTGTLTVSITNVVAAQDQLLITATGTVTFDATTVSVGGIQIATYTGGGAGGAPLVFTFDADATPAAVQELMRALAYVNSDNQDPTSGTRNISWTLVDGDGQANGGADTLTVSSAVNVIGVNDEPSGTDVARTFNEDATYTFAPADFGFSDVDGDNFIGVRFTTLPGVGTIFLDTDGPGGAAPIMVSAGDIVALSEINAGHVYYVPAANGNGAPYASFTFQVRDDGGTTNGGVDLDQTPNTFTFNVNSVNDAPTSTNLQGDAATWIEGSAATLLDVGSNATVADIDSMNFDGGTLTVLLSGGNVAQDGLFIEQVGGITSDATTVSFMGTQIGTYVGGGFGGGNIVFTFDADATPAAVQALMRALSYNNNGGISPTAGTRNVTWTLVDGDGTANGGQDTLIIGSTVDVQAINDAPTGADATYVINEDATYTFSETSFGYGDVNGDDFAGVVVTTIPVPGTLFYDSDGPGGAAAVAVVAGQFVSAADIALGRLYYTPVANGNGVPFSSFTFQVRDDGGTGNGGQDTDQSANTITFNVTAVNDAPVNTVPGAQTINEDGSFTLSTGNGNAIQVADVDASTLTVTLSVANGTLTIASTLGLTFSGGSDGTADATMTFSGTAAAINAALGAGLTYNPTANYNGPDAISVQTTDNGETGTGGVGTDSDSIPITINSVNDAPQGTDGAVTGSEDDPYVFTAADFGFSDPVEGNAFFAVQITTLPAEGDILLNGAPVLAGDFIAVSAINAGMLTFQPDPDEFGSPYTTFTFRVQDNGGTTNGGVDTDPVANTLTINIAPDNLPPAVDLDGGLGGIDASVSYTENAPGIAIGSAITVTDPDSGLGDLIEGATITLTDAVAGDALTVILPLPGGITAVTTNPAGQIVITLSGQASHADYATALGQIRYSSTLDDFGGDTARTITVTVTDGTATSATATSTVTITPVDDAPVAQPDAFTTNENVVLSSSVFPNNGSGPDSDVDGPALQVSEVNGSGANVGTQIALASGALLTLNADGTFSYNPNGAFNSLPDFVSSGASNTTAPDSFTYALAGGNTVTVTLTVRGVDSNGDVLLGTPGVDTLNGGIGADTMTGFSGNDTFFVDDAGDVVIEGAGGGDDTIRSSISYTLAAGLSVETLTTTIPAGAGAIDLTGNEIGQRIEGNNGANVLTGNGGADLIFGLDGDDTLNGGAQSDLLDGGDGIDTATFTGALTFTDFAIGWLITSAEGSDTLQNVEIAIAGSGQRNLLVESTGFDSIQDASDEAQNGDIIRLAAGNYTESVNYSAQNLLVLAQAGAIQNVDYATASGFGITIVAANGHDTISTGDGDDLIIGGGGDDDLSGGGGNDTFYGEGGNDTTRGGTGDDVYIVDSTGDVVIEAGGEGSDSVLTQVSFVLTSGAEVELLSTTVHSGTSAIELTGNFGSQTIIGNFGDNVITGGGAGADHLVGLAGNDTYIVHDGAASVEEDAGAGNDTVFASVSFALAGASSVELMSTTFHLGTSAINLTGSSTSQTIFGNFGANVLDGKGGADILVGFAGADTFAFTSALGGGNIDIIDDFLSGTDKIALDDAVFSALSAGSLPAGAFVIGTAAGDADDRIIYNSATGALFYDADGNGAGAAVQFATLNGHPVLVASDFQVI